MRHFEESEFEEPQPDEHELIQLQEVRDIIWPNRPDMHFPIKNRRHYGEVLDQLQETSANRRVILDKYTSGVALSVNDLSVAAGDSVLAEYVGYFAENESRPNLSLSDSVSF